MFRRNLLAVAAVLGIAVPSIAHAAPITDVVFGNLGASGTNALSPATNASISDTTWLMHGFTVGGTNNVLQTIKLGLSDNDSTIARVQVFLDSGGVPSGSALGTQAAAVSSLTPSFQTFNFGSLSLNIGSSYWVVVSAPTSSSLFNWAFNNDGDFPTGQNLSGWSPSSPNTKISTNSGLTWGASGGNRPASISITAVPEPSTYALAAIGLGIAGFARWRRRASRSGR